jgi:diguanylate cyclase (GGDEF)-like protein/PAS domain S-box-containing protein
MGSGASGDDPDVRPRAPGDHGDELVLQLSLRRLTESERRFREVFERAPVGLLLLDPDGRVLESNRAFRSMIGRASEDLIGAPYSLLLHGDEEPFAFPGSGRLEQRLLHADGHEVWGSATSVAVEEPDGTRLVLVCIDDITQRRGAEAQLLHAALHDSLTDLPNRRLMRDRLATALARATRTGSTVAVLFLDLDEFKTVNDSLGHDAGDDLLVAIGRNLSSALRACDTVARLGGDEFVVICEDVAEEGDVHRLARRVMDAVERPLSLIGNPTRVTASMGVATPGPGYESADELLHLADIAMYRAKGSGKSRYVVADERLHAETAARLDLVADLRHAIQHDELVLHYQPVALLDGGLIGMEALLRWPHPSLGLLRPGDFLPLVEGSDLAKPLSDWVLRSAIGDAARWANGSLRVSVNVTARELDHPDFADTVLELLEWSGLRARSLWLDVQEADLVQASTTARQTVARLRAHGVGVAADDFGRSSGSLADLGSMPVDLVKIHPEFIAGMLDDPVDAAIIAAIVTAARASGRHALAEGVETPGQLEMLRTLGLESVQGHLTSRPAPLADLTEILATRRVDLT